MKFEGKAIDATALVRELTTLLPDYMPGIATGDVELTDRRRCWTKSLVAVLDMLGRERSYTVLDETQGTYEAQRQMRVFWTSQDALAFAAFSGWGSRDDLERSFHQLLLLKCPRKAIIYTCARWHEAVLDQLSAAVLRYPHHIEGEQYLALNILGAEGKLVATTCVLEHGGKVSLAEATFQPLPGSPFRWGLSKSAPGGD